MPLPRLFAIVGPTASGKTDLAIEIAERFDAEIINADSRQVYRGLDIGSAKPTAAQQQRVRHHLLDICDPHEQFNCAQFRDQALAAAHEISARGKRIVLAGGTGLYVRVLRGGLFDGPPRDQALRQSLEALEAAQPGALLSRLSRVDPTSAARLHPNDRVRLIRAIEVFETSGRTISDWQREHAFAERDVETRTIVLDLPREELYRRIDARCQTMLDQGFIEEVKRLLDAGLDPQLPSLQSLGYREIGEFVRGRRTLDVALHLMRQETRRFAKRQLTWFRGDREVEWMAPQVELVHDAAAVFFNPPRAAG